MDKKKILQNHFAERRFGERRERKRTAPEEQQFTTETLQFNFYITINHVLKPSSSIARPEEKQP